MGKAEDASSSGYARAALGQAARNAELSFSVVRVVFSALIAVRFVWIHTYLDIPDAVMRGLVMLPPTVIAAAFSAFMLVRLKRDEQSPALLAVSVVADPALCTFAIGSNVLWPFPGYRGVLLLPETATFLALMFAAGFRASSRLAWIGALANGAGLGALVVLDAVLHPETSSMRANVLSLYVVLFGATATLSIWGARRTERLVEEAARHSYKNARAEHGLSSLLEAHHDAMSLLSAVLFDVDHLKRGAGPADVASVARDLEQLGRAVSQIKERALHEALLLRPAIRVSVSAVIERCHATFSRITAPARLSWETSEEDPHVWVAGGALALQRVLANLLTNAREGDGNRGAENIVVRVATEGSSARIAVEDDGPGFGATAGAYAVTTKAGGTATGLRFVRAVADASGGGLHLENTGKGARVTVTLPVARLPSEGALVEEVLG